MDSLHVQELALIRIRLIADIVRVAQCNNDEFNIVIEMISEMADMALPETSNEEDSGSA